MKISNLNEIKKDQADKYESIRNLFIISRASIRQGIEYYGAVCDLLNNKQISKKQEGEMWDEIGCFYEECLESSQFIADMKAFEELMNAKKLVAA